MPDLPTQSVTEEKYKDENGHIIVKKVNQIVQKRSCVCIHCSIYTGFELLCYVIKV